MVCAGMMVVAAAIAAATLRVSSRDVLQEVAVVS
jgi:hypothetical protein